MIWRVVKLFGRIRVLKLDLVFGDLGFYSASEVIGEIQRS